MRKSGGAETGKNGEDWGRAVWFHARKSITDAIFALRIGRKVERETERAALHLY